MTAAEDLTEGLCTDDPFPGERVTAARLCGGGFLMEGLEDATRNEGQSNSEGLEPAESACVNGTPDVVPHRVERVAWVVVRCSSCSSSDSHCHVARVGRGGLASSTYSGAE